MAEDFASLTFDPDAPRSGPEDDSYFGTRLKQGALDIGQGALALGGAGARAVGLNATGALLDEYRGDLGEVNEELEASLSERNRRAGASAFLPEEGQASIFDDPLRALGNKLTRTTPSLVASMVPAGMVARALGATAGAITGGVTAGVMDAGEVYNSIYEEVGKLPDAELQGVNDMYRSLRGMGLDEKSARAQVADTLAGYKPVIVGAISALTAGGFGAEGMVAGALGGEAKRGFRRGLVRGAKGEAAQEATVGFAGSVSEEMALEEGGISPFEWRKVINNTLESGVIGGLMGAPVGGITNIGGGVEKVQPGAPNSAQTAALAGSLNTSSATTPPATPPAPPATPPAGTTAAAGPTTPSASPPAKAGPAAATPDPLTTANAAMDGAAAATPPSAPAAPTQAAPTDPYERAVQLTREKGYGSTSYIQRSLGLRYNDAAALMDRMEQDGVVGPANHAGRREVLAPKAPAGDPLAAGSAAMDAAKVAKEADQETVPETADTLQAQVDDLAKGVRPAVLFPTGTKVKDRPDRPEGMKQAAVPGAGTVYYNPKLTNYAELVAAQKAGKLNELLNMAATSKEEAAQDIAAGATPAAVVVRNPAGVEKVAAASSSATVDGDVREIAAKAAPGDKVTVENPAEVVAKRGRGRPSKKPTKEQVEAERAARLANADPALLARLNAEANSKPAPVTPEVAPAAPAPKPVEETVKVLPNGKRVLTANTPEALAKEQENVQKATAALEGNLTKANEDDERRQQLIRQAADGYVESGETDGDADGSDSRTRVYKVNPDGTHPKVKGKSKAWMAKRERDIAVAKRVLADNPMSDMEKTAYGSDDTKSPPGAKKAKRLEGRAQLKTRLRNMMAELRKEGVTIPQEWRAGTPPWLGFLLNMKAMHDALEKGTAKETHIATYLGDEFKAAILDANLGEWEEIRQRRLTEGDKKLKTGTQDGNSGFNEGRTELSEDGLLAGAERTKDTSEAVGRESTEPTGIEAVADEDAADREDEELTARAAEEREKALAAIKADEERRAALRREESRRLAESGALKPKETDTTSAATTVAKREELADLKPKVEGKVKLTPRKEKPPVTPKVAEVQAVAEKRGSNGGPTESAAEKVSDARMNMRANGKSLTKDAANAKQDIDRAGVEARQTLGSEEYQAQAKVARENVEAAQAEAKSALAELRERNNRMFPQKKSETIDLWEGGDATPALDEDFATGKPVVADVFHGTTKAFERFMAKFKGSNFLSDFGAFWFTSDPMVANSYTRAAKAANDTNAEEIVGEPNVHMSRIQLVNPLVVDMKGQGYDPIIWNRTLKKAKEGNHDGVVMLNAVDGGGVTSRVFAVFDEASISTQFNADRAEGQLFPLSEDEADALLSQITSAPPTKTSTATVDTVEGNTGKTARVVATIEAGKALKSLPLEDLGGLAGKLFPMIRDRLVKTVGDVKIHVVSAAEMRTLTKDGNPGFYLSGKDYIVISRAVLDNPALFARTVMHEALHAATVKGLSDPVLRGKVKALMGELDFYFGGDTARSHGIDRDGTIRELYGFRNADEFIAEAFSNKEFQDFLARTEIDEATARKLGMERWRRRTLWNALVSAIRTFFKMSPDTYSALEAALRVTESAMDARPATSPSYAKLLGAEPFTARVTGAAADRRAGAVGWLRKYAVKGMSLTQLSQQFRGKFQKGGEDLLDKLTAAVRRMEPYADAKRAQAETLAQKFIEFSRANKEEADRFSDLAMRATMAGVNLGANANNSHLGKTALRGVQAKQLLPKLQAEFAQLSPQAQALWTEMSSFYRDQQNEMTRGLIENILDTLPAAVRSQLTGQARSDLIDRIMAGTMQDTDEKLLASPTVFKALKEAAELRKWNGVYFPLMRFGDIVVETLDGHGDLKGGTVTPEGYVAFSAATDKDARAKAEAYLKASPLTFLSFRVRYFDGQGKRLKPEDAKRMSGVRVEYQLNMQRRGLHVFESRAEAEKFRREATGYEKVGEVQSMRDTAMGSHELTSAQLNSLLSSISARKDISDGHRALMRSSIYQASARLMRGNRVQKRSLARQNVQGASKDMGRVMLQYGEATSRYQANIKLMPEVRSILSDMREVANDLKYEQGQAARIEILNEVTERLERNVLQPNAPGAFMQTALQLSFLSRLFSPAYSIVNAMQTMMVSYPVLAGRYGAVRASAALARAAADLGMGEAALGGVMNTVRATRQFAKTSLLNTSDIVGSIRANLAKAADGAELTAMLDELVAQGLIKSDAGFELASAISQGVGPTRKTLAKVDRIARQLPAAVEAVNRTMTAVAAYRLARAANMSPAKATAFALETTDNTQGDYRSSIGSPIFNNPVLRPALQFKRYAQMMTYLLADMVKRAAFAPGERAVAMKQLANLMGVQIAMAGVFSLPGIEIAKVGMMVAAALGFGDGWDDEEFKLRKLADETFGETWGELFSRGVLSRAVGVDLSSRVSLADMWTFGEPKSAERGDLQAYMFNLILGAPGGLGLDYLEGIRKAGEGEWGKAVEKLAPTKFLIDFAKGVNRYNKGDTSLGEAALNVVGFRSGAQAEEGEARAAKARANAKKEQEYKKLQRAFYEARTPGERVKAIARNREWNKEAPVRFKLPVRYKEEKRAS